MNKYFMKFVIVKIKIIFWNFLYICIYVMDNYINICISNVLVLCMWYIVILFMNEWNKDLGINEK